MYTEQVDILCDVGLHGETLNAFNTHFPPGVAFINGMDVAEDYQQLYLTLSSARSAEVGANTGDPTTDKNVVDIIHGIANFGHDPWRGKGVIPPQLYAQAAEMMRNDPRFGLQGGMQMQPSAPVSGEMTATATKKTALWSVVALGELQQPGGVGATEQYNPVLDGPNPEGPNFSDNSQNSQEQEMALQTWVNHALNMLNQGDEPDVVVAKLAHDGCPEPEQVLKMAMEQPEKDVMEDPVTDEIGQDPFEAPVADDQTGQMQDVFRQPPVVQAKRVRIANTSLTGVELDRWEDMWGQGTAKIALDDGGTMNVSTDVVEEVDSKTPEHPVSQIQKFVDSLPKVEPTRPHIQARIDNLELVRRAVRSTVSKVGFSDQVKLQKMDMDAQTEIMALKDSLGATISESDVAYLSGQQTYRPHGVDFPGVERATVRDEGFRMAEKAAIFVSELPSEMISDAEGVAYAAARYASEHNADVAEFMKLAEDQRFQQWQGTGFQEPPQQEEFVDNEGPAEGLYL